MHFIHKILCFEEFLHKIALFLQKLCFPDFRLIKSVSRLVENAIKILVWIWPFQSLLDWFWINRRHFWSIESNFRSIENRIKSYFKTLSFHVFNHFQTFSKHFSLSLRSVKASNHYFCCFPSNFFKGFCPLRLVRPFCPSFFHLFSCFMHYFMHFRENVKPMKIWDFC